MTDDTRDDESNGPERDGGGATDDARDDEPGATPARRSSEPATDPEPRLGSGAAGRPPGAGPGGTLGRAALVAGVALLAAVVAGGLFVVVPASLADLLGVLVAVAVVAAAAVQATRLGRSVFPDYNVAEVGVEGPITRSGGSPSPLRVAGTTADDVVDSIEAADETDAVDALLVRLNTPGGEVVPSDDLRRAVESFDGPTVAYATDVCASGGYWIASGCDEVWARDASLVGSIGVLGSRPNAAGLADRLGVSYERFVGGRYKDAGSPLKEPDEDDRAYLQGIVDGLYDDFVERVAEGRGLSPETVRETEARVFLGDEAADRGLVDHLGGRDDAVDALEDRLGVEVSVERFEPSTGLRDRLRGGAVAVAHALGAGVARALLSDDAALRPPRLRR